MRTGTFGKLLVVTVIAAVAAVYVLQHRDQGPVVAGTGPLFPGLADSINDVSALTITTSTGAVTLRHDGETWRIEERGGYPARFELVKSVLLGVADLAALEPRTSKPENHAKLGLADPEQADSDSTLVTLTGSQGSALAAVIVGHPGPAANTLYVRKSGDNQTWLARGSISPERQPTGWMDRDLLKLARGRVRDVTLRQADGESLVVSHENEEDTDWSVHDVPDGKELVSPAAGRPIGTALEALNFDDVATLASQPLPADDRVTAVFETFDGLRVTVESATVTTEGEADPTAADPTAKPPVKKTWATVRAEATDTATDAVKTEATDLAARVEPWIFEFSEYRGGILRKRMADLVKDKAPPPAATPEAPADGTPPSEQPASEPMPLPEPADGAPASEEPPTKP